jgi:hypothetical protein
MARTGLRDTRVCAHLVQNVGPIVRRVALVLEQEVFVVVAVEQDVVLANLGSLEAGPFEHDNQARLFILRVRSSFALHDRLGRLGGTHRVDSLGFNVDRPQHRCATLHFHTEL